MNKSKVPMLGVMAFMECLLLICTLKLVNYSIYAWIVAVILLCTFGVTVYRFIAEIADVLGILQEKMVLSYEKDMAGMFQQITENNKEQNDKIENMFEQQKKICADAIDRLSGLESENIQVLEKSYKNCLTENSVQLVDKYNELLKETYAKFEKSVEGQTEVFVENVNRLNKSCDDILTKSHKKIDGQIEKFSREISEVNKKMLSENAQEYKELVQSSSLELAGKYENLIKDMINQYNDMMIQYKAEFVKANVEALANTEKANLDIITKAHQDISELKEVIQKIDGKNEENVKNMMYLLEEIEKCIEKGITTQSEQFGDFNEDFGEELTKMSKTMKQQFQRYLDTTDEYRKDIKLISEGIAGTTKEYKELFNEVRKNQQEMNDLTKEDISLLNKLMKK